MIELFPGKLYKLGDKLCKGFYTGDDFCDVSTTTVLYPAAGEAGIM